MVGRVRCELALGELNGVAIAAPVNSKQADTAPRVVCMIGFITGKLHVGQKVPVPRL
jgi:hypothetical protein